LTKIIDKIKPTQAILTTLYHNQASNTPTDKVDEANTIIRALAKERNIPLIDIEKDNTVATSDLA
jgi:lysophospholipase L1-like esterase